MALSLTTLFDELPRDQSTRHINKDDKNYILIEKLARKFGMTFGQKLGEHREEVMSLHCEGISYAVQANKNLQPPDGIPPYLTFLEVLTELSKKLSDDDKKIILSFLDRKIRESFPQAKVGGWFSLVMYKTSLQESPVEKAAQTRQNRRNTSVAHDDATGRESNAESDPTTTI